MTGFCQVFAIGPEKEEIGWSWALIVDNDLFVMGEQDSGYTGGVAYKLSGSGVLSNPLSAFGPLQWLNDISGFESNYRDELSHKTHSMEFGFTLFTPENLDARQPLPNEHPYASLFFVNSSQMVVLPGQFLSYQSSLSIGALGLSVGGDLHELLHDLFDADMPEGWDNQISAGGEPTFRYSLTRSRSHIFDHNGGAQLEMKTSTALNLGYATDVGASMSLRWGRITSPWWSFNPHNAEYISLGTPVAPRVGENLAESYLWFGGSLRYRIYNAILQGQFRDSVVSFDRDELEQVVAEIWLGYTYGFGEGWRINGFLRGRSKEIDLPGMTNPAWGGVVLSRAF